MRFRAPLGHSDFQKLRGANATYVDKTSLVVDILDDPHEVLLLPRPRRFGKTLNLSTLRAFLERTDDDRTDLFEGLEVWRSEEARRHFQRYPVVFLTFKDVKAHTFDDCLAGVRALVGQEVLRHSRALDQAGLEGLEAEACRQLRDGRADKVTLWSSLRHLTAWLSRATGERAVVLIDEYDMPIHAGYSHGYYDEATEFFRNFLSGGLKDNPHLFRGVVTGILRVARESIFSGLNNLAVHSLLSRRFATAFGFTEAEVEQLADLAGAKNGTDDLRRWYDGYLFGGEVVYNPWSVLSYLANPDDGYVPYWVSTSSNDLLRDLLTRGGLGDPAHLETLLSGGGVDRRIEENIVFRDLDRRPGAVWSLLLFSGYLIPNREVRTVWRTTFLDWLEAGLGGQSAVRALFSALLAGDADTFGRYLTDLLRDTLSYHDVAGPRRERIYHAFIAGLLVHLGDEYEVRSNRESGYGRYDVMVLPKAAGRPGVVLELKVPAEDEDVEGALDAARRQLAEREYAAELRARGAEPVHELAVVFDGKRAWVRGAG